MIYVIDEIIRRRDEKSLMPWLAENKSFKSLNPDGPSGPLDMAARFGWVKGLALLVAAGCEVDWHRADDGGAMFGAVEWGNVDCVRCLLDLGSSVNATNATHYTPVFYAVYMSGFARGEGSGTGRFHKEAPEYQRTVQSLGERAADVNIPNDQGRTPNAEVSAYNNASYYPDRELVQILLDLGAEDTPDLHGVRPSDSSDDAGLASIAQELRRRSAP